MLVALAGCSRANPAFDPTADSIPMGGTGAEMTGKPPGMTGVVTTDASASMTGQDSSDPTSAATGGEQGSSTTDPFVESGSTAFEDPKACDQPPAADLFAITVASIDSDLDPGCQAVLDFDEFGTIVPIDGGQRIELVICDFECPCSPIDGTVWEIDLGEPNVIPGNLPLLECGRVALWGASAPGMGKCTWSGFAVEYGGLAPRAIGSNTMEVPAEFDIGLEWAMGERCGEEGCPRGLPPPGGHGIAHGADIAWVGDTIQVPFGGANFDVLNRGSNVTEDCREDVSWLATR